MALRYSALCLTLALLPACGDSEPADETETTAADTNADGESETAADGTEESTEETGGIEIDCATDAWDLSADTEWKGAWMAACMIPAIQPIMQGIDPVAYETLQCSHCHGEDLGGGEFAMPAAVTLDWADAANWPTEYYDGTTFMGPMAEVATTAADLLGYEPFDPMTGEGFACGGCHVGL